jgi:hypothetical protein
MESKCYLRLLISTSTSSTMKTFNFQFGFDCCMFWLIASIHLQFVSLCYSSLLIKPYIWFEGMYVVSTLLIPNMKSTVHINLCIETSKCRCCIMCRVPYKNYVFKSKIQYGWHIPCLVYVFQLEVKQSPLKAQFGIRKQQHENGKWNIGYPLYSHSHSPSIKSIVKVIINAHKMYKGTCFRYIRVLLCFNKSNFWLSHALNMMQFHPFDTLTSRHKNIHNLTMC